MTPKQCPMSHLSALRLSSNKNNYFKNKELIFGIDYALFPLGRFTGDSHMEVIGHNFYLGLVEDVSSLVSKSSRRSLLKHQTAIVMLVDTIGLVRQHRAYTHQFLFHQQEAIQEGIPDKIAHLDQQLSKQAVRLSNNRYIGDSIERISLRHKLIQLTGNYKQCSVANNLVVHGKVIRQLIYQIDSQMIISLDKAGQLEFAGDYNDQWQSVMSAIEALTLYRLDIMAMNMGLKPALLAKQASLLHAKLVNVAKIYVDFHPDLNDCIGHLSQHLTEHEPSLEYQDKMFMLSSEISAALIDVYKTIIEKTYTKAVYCGYPA